MGSCLSFWGPGTYGGFVQRARGLHLKMSCSRASARLDRQEKHSGLASNAGQYNLVIEQILREHWAC